VEAAHLIIDTDPGIDDALAILMAHAHADVAALTVAGGNVGLAHTTRNALKLIETIGADTPVHPGCASALVFDAADAGFVHGADGFGDTGYFPALRLPEEEHVASAIVRLARERPGELTLVALAPLTNLALALRLDPSLPQRVARLVVMGGAVTGRGNTSASAEFNVGFDPEAAHIVFSSWPRLELVDWELVTRHGVAFETMGRWLAIDNPRARFFDAISRKTRAWTRTRGRPKLLVADALAMAIALQPDIVTHAEDHHIAIELDGKLTRGTTIVDWENRSGQVPNARIALDVDQSRFEALVASALDGGG
jgi:purine nucleosidase